MTAREKAIELVEKYKNESWVIGKDTAKKCALIAVNEILGYRGADMLREYIFWQNVKTEIENL